MFNRFLGTLILTLALATPTLAQWNKPSSETKPAAEPAPPPPPPHKAPKAEHKHPDAAREDSAQPGAKIGHAITLGARVGMNVPTSKMGTGFTPDLEAGFRFGLGPVAIEPAFGWQTWNGNYTGNLDPTWRYQPYFGYKQSTSASIYEGRARLWLDAGKPGFVLCGLGVGAVAAHTSQVSWSGTRTESGNALTWTVQAGWAYPIPAAQGNLELLLGYRSAPVDFVTTGNVNASGFQALLGWHAAINPF